MILLSIISSNKEGFLIFSIPAILISFFFAILFLQSGLDKVFNYKGEYEWTKEHFSKSALRRLIIIIFPLLTFFELGTGLLSLSSTAMFLVTKNTDGFFYAFLFSCLTILMLFFGQRMAKDYAGAVSLTGYFIVSILGLWMCFLLG
jgi:hypothetical protein